MLVMVVISVWGLIIRMVISVVKDDPRPGAAYRPVFSAIKSVEIPAAYTGIPLKLDFPDPFLKNDVKVSTLAGSPPVSNKTSIAPPVKKTDLGFIRFEGFILTENNKRILLVSINGRDYMAESGGTEQGVSFISFTEEVLTIKFQHKLFKIYKE